MSAQEFKLACPVAKEAGDEITMAHGGGGRVMHRLIEDVFRGVFNDPELERAHDGAFVDVKDGCLAFTTDSFVVRPLFFPGGDIGSLAVHGTANDLAMCGAEPLFLSCGFILEEGLLISTLRKAAQSMAKAAKAAGLRVVTGDTKVVERGKGDGIYVNTAGIGRRLLARRPDPSGVVAGDVILASGDVGAHGAAILSVREGLEFETAVLSDSAAVWPQVKALIEADVEIHCLRDLTRGGLATALNEIAGSSKLGLSIEEDLIPVRPEVASACEVFGLEPLYMACEGRFIVFVPERGSARALEVLAKACPGQAPALIGKAADRHPGEVRMTTKIGVERMLDMLSGEQLPRIC